MYQKLQTSQDKLKHESSLSFFVDAHEDELSKDKLEESFVMYSFEPLCRTILTSLIIYQMDFEFQA